jgi:hypothetical protein
MVVMGYLRGRRIKRYWLMMNLAKRFKMPNGVVIFLDHSKIRCCQRTRCNGWTSHLVCGHPWLDYHWLKWFKFIMILWSSILSFD